MGQPGKSQAFNPLIPSCPPIPLVFFLWGYSLGRSGTA